MHKNLLCHSIYNNPCIPLYSGDENKSIQQCQHSRHLKTFSIDVYKTRVAFGGEIEAQFKYERNQSSGRGVTVKLGRLSGFRQSLGCQVYTYSKIARQSCSQKLGQIWCDCLFFFLRKIDSQIRKNSSLSPFYKRNFQSAGSVK